MGTNPQLCKCCKDHPQEADVELTPFECVECGELCQCKNCWQDRQFEDSFTNP